MTIPSVIKSIALWFIALIFASGFAVTLMTIIRANFLTRGLDMNLPVDQTISICGLSAFLAVLAAWKWLGFSSIRNRFMRFLLAFVILTIAFGTIGGILVIINNYWNYEGPDRVLDWKFLYDGLYWESVNGFYSFALFIIGELRWQMALAFVIVAFGIAILSPLKKVSKSVKFGRLESAD